MIWFTADLHLGHKNIIEYCDRPFSTVEEMDETLIKNWNNCVKKNDIIIVLGDFIWNEQNIEGYSKRLKGQIHLIRGCHDKLEVEEYTKFGVMLLDPLSLYDHSYVQIIILCHYQMKTWYKSHYNSWHLFGHSHGQAVEYGKSMDVGVDCNDYKPVSMQQVTKIMDDKENNENYVG
jgi:calcineurin-like phosphoesterase family protein